MFWSYKYCEVSNFIQRYGLSKQSKISQKYISTLDLETFLTTEGINADIVLKFYLDTITILFTQYNTSQQKH